MLDTTLDDPVVIVTTNIFKGSCWCYGHRTLHFQCSARNVVYPMQVLKLLWRRTLYAME